MAELLHSWREATKTQEVPAATVGSTPQGELALLALPDPLPLWHTQLPAETLGEGGSSSARPFSSVLN